MNIGIIGGGITGLTAAYELAKRGHRVVVFEKNAELGGQVATFEVGGGRLERFYHHIFTGDVDMIHLIDELGLGQKLAWLESKVGICHAGMLYDFVTPLDLLKFPVINPLDRLRLGLVSLWLQHRRNWQTFEAITAREWIIKHAGKRNYEVVWEPLLRGKFGECSDEVSMVWFWGKIYLRLGSRGKGMQRERLGYLMGSFGLVIDALSRRIRELGGELCTSSPAERIVTKGNMVKGIWVGGQMRSLDAIIATIPSNSFLKLTPEMPRDYALKLREVRYQAAVCLTLATKKPLSRFYWLNISDLSIPFVGVIEHTNFIDKIHYGGKHIIYLSNYISPGSPLYRKDASALLEEYLPHLEKINPDFNPNWIEEYYLFSEEAGQPIVSTNYSNRIPDHRTPISGLYLANTTQIYPQDRGMNYSVRLGIEVAKLLTEDVSGYSER